MADLAENEIVVIGAGPAGLTAALELARADKKCTVLESDPDYVGGIARTVLFGEFRLDIGGHRFYTKVGEVEQFWKEILGPDFIEVQRCSRIYFNRKFFKYPLQGRDVFMKLGFMESTICGLSYLHRRLRPHAPEISFKDWVCNRFGDRLFRMFFENYTEKVWGIKCNEISKDWASERIQDLDAIRVLKSIFFRSMDSRDSQFKTLIDRFDYPRLGCGMLWERVRDMLNEQGSPVVLDREVIKINLSEGRITSVDCRTGTGEELSVPCNHLISSMALRDLIERMVPAPPQEVLNAARQLKYRDFLTVALVLRASDPFKDQWIYIHEPEVKLGRIQNFRNWSPEMVPDSSVSLLGLEYFCFEGDGMWTMADADLIELGAKELVKIGLARREDILDGTVVRMQKAYPIYDDQYKTHVEIIRNWLGTIPNIASAGRNAMHQYNNQDHSIMAALIAARNHIGTDERDPWKVSHDAQYLETRLIPERIDLKSVGV